MNSSRDDVAANLANLKINEDTNWNELFALPTQYHNQVLQLFYKDLEARLKNDEVKKKFGAYHKKIKEVLKKPQQLREELNKIPANERLQLIFNKCWEFRSYLHISSLLDDAAEYDIPAASMKIILECLPQGLLLYTDILPKFLYVEDKVDTYLNMLHPAHRSSLLRVRDKDQNTLLHRAADYPETFIKLLNLADTEEQKFNAVMAKDKYGVAVFQLAAHRDESFTAAFSVIPDARKFEAATYQAEKDGKSLLQYAGTKNVMLQILKIYPIDERFDALTHKHKYDYPAIANACRDFEWLWSILNLLKTKQRQQLMAATGDKGRELIASLAKRNPEQMLKLIESYAPDERLDAVRFKELLDCPPETIIAVMNLLPDTVRLYPEHRIKRTNDRIDFLTMSLRNYYEGFILVYAKRNFDNCMKVLDAIASNADRLKVIKLSDLPGSEFMSLAAKHSPAAFAKYLQLFPDNEKLDVLTQQFEKIKWLMEPCEDNYDRVIDGLHSHEMIKTAVFSLPAKDRLTFLLTSTKKWGQKKSLLNNSYDIFRLPELIEILTSLPEQDLLKAIAARIESYSDSKGPFDITIREALKAKPEYEEQFKSVIRLYDDAHPAKDGTNQPAPAPQSSKSIFSPFLGLLSHLFDTDEHAFHDKLKIAREEKSHNSFGIFDSTAKFALIPDFIPKTLSVEEYKQLQKLHNELQTESRRLRAITDSEYWDSDANYKNANILGQLEQLRNILKPFAQSMEKEHGIKPVSVDKYTVTYKVLYNGIPH
ncbi:MAG TPA: hypothetical protein VL360_02960 [Gammaproteobacteria bacterium]|nr:hypothetical protein [Gammaproteobacteria bacterium]